MNAVVADLTAADTRVGVLSVGIDGELRDAISGLAKPTIHLARGSLVATARDALRARGVVAEILHATGIATPLGELVVARLTRAGDVLLAGVRHRADARTLCAAMHNAGADSILIDGAFDRFASADPALSDALVVATGAAVADSEEFIVARTVGFTRRMRLPIADARTPLDSLGGAAVLGPSGVRVVGSAGTAEFEDQLRRAWLDGDRAVAVPGLVSDRVLESVRRVTAPGTVLHARDPSRVVGTDAELDRFLRRRLIEVERAAPIAAVTVNPRRADGHLVDEASLLTAVGSALPDLPVIDVAARRRFGADGTR